MGFIEGRAIIALPFLNTLLPVIVNCQAIFLLKTCGGSDNPVSYLFLPVILMFRSRFIIQDLKS